MGEDDRIDNLRRRVRENPASIAFAQLAEECRRAGEHEEAVEVCRAGLAVHPGYLSAKVTLGRALLALGRLDDAQLELHTVLVSAPDNLAAVRSLGEIFQARGQPAAALSYYQQALGLARNDPHLQQAVSDLTRDLAEATAREPHDRPALPKSTPAEPPLSAAIPVPTASIALPAASPLPLPSRERRWSTEVPVLTATDDLERQHALRTIAALEQWLTALHGPGAERYP